MPHVCESTQSTKAVVYERVGVAESSHAKRRDRGPVRPLSYSLSVVVVVRF